MRIFTDAATLTALYTTSVVSALSSNISGLDVRLRVSVVRGSQRLDFHTDVRFPTMKRNGKACITQRRIMPSRYFSCEHNYRSGTPYKGYVVGAGKSVNMRFEEMESRAAADPCCYAVRDFGKSVVWNRPHHSPLHLPTSCQG